MNAAQLEQIADALELAAGISTPATDSEAGRWFRITTASEALSQTTSTANPTVHGYMLRTAQALEVLSLTSGAEENDGYEGFLKRIVDALEVKAGAASVGSMSYRAVVASLAAVFEYTPLALFAASEPGVWYDTSDLSTMFVDSAGVTPASVGQPVGLLLDKRLGLVAGAELNPDPGFNTPANWATGAGRAISGGTASWDGSSGGSIYTANTGAIAGQLYEITFTIVSISGGVLKANAGNNYGPDRTAPGTYTQRVLFGSTPNVMGVYTPAAGVTAVIDNFSVKLLPGNHATQTTTAAKPILRQHYEAVGAELVSNGDFSNGLTGWTYPLGSGGTISVVGGAARVTGGTAPGFRKSGIMEVGKTYVVTYTATRISGAANHFVGGLGAYLEPAMSAALDGTRRIVAVASTVNLDLGIAGDASTTEWQFDNISVKEATANGYYLEFDGVDDRLLALFTIAQPWDRISGLQMITYTASDRLYGEAAGVTAGMLYTPGSPTGRISIHDGIVGGANNDLAIGVNGVVTERHDSPNSRLGVNNNAYIISDSGTNIPGGVSIGATAAGAAASNIRFYGTVMIGRAPTYGAEMLADTTASDASKWTLGAGAAITGGQLVLTAMSSNTRQTGQLIAPEIGKTYAYSFTVASYTSGNVILNVGGASPANASAVGTYSGTFTATATTTFGFLGSGNPTAALDNFSLKEVLTPGGLTDAEITDIKSLLASKSGVTL